MEKMPNGKLNYYGSPVYSGLVRKLEGRCDELNLFLTANGLKPASTVAFNTNRRHSKVTADKDELSQFRNLLDALGLPHAEYRGRFSPFKRMMRRHCRGRLRRTNDYDAWMGFSVGMDEEALDKLVKAESDEKVGLAYGYPKEAVEAFQKVIEGETRNPAYLMVSIAKARTAGVKIPAWMAYISHIPEESDFVNGRVSPSSEALGEKYRSFVRKYAPDLARRLEGTIEGFNESNEALLEMRKLMLTEK